MKPAGWYFVGLLAVLLTGIGAAVLCFEMRDAPDGQSTAQAESFPLIPGDLMAALDAQQRTALTLWLAANPAYQMVSRDYCGCALISDANPYLSVFDFNGDGHKDLAAVLAMTGGAGEPMTLFVFNGPFDRELPKPAFTASHWQRNDALFGNFIGPPESDNGYSIVWKNGTYELEYEGNVG